MILRIELNPGNQSVCADSVKPFYKEWALLILQNYLRVLYHLVFNNILHILHIIIKYFPFDIQFIAFYLFIIMLTLILVGLFIFRYCFI